MVNEYFLPQPFWVGGTSTAPLRIFPEPRYSEAYLPPARRKAVVNSVNAMERQMEERETRPPVGAVEKYYSALAQSEPGDWMIILSTETTYAPPHSAQKTELASTHPNNFAVLRALRRAQALQTAGKTSAVVVIDPPYIAELKPKKVDGRIIAEPVAPIAPHSFRFWDNIDAQQNSFRRKRNRAEVYSEFGPRDYRAPDWDRQTELLRMRGLESLLIEKLVKTVLEKCTEGFYLLMPNSSESKKRIKETLLREASGRDEWGEEFDLEAADILGNLVGFTQTPEYLNFGICAPQVWGMIDRYLENDFRIKIREDYPRVQEPENENLLYSDLIPQAFEALNEDNKHWGKGQYDSDYIFEIQKFLTEKKVWVSSLQKIVSEISRDLDSPLKPLEISPQSEPRKINAGVSDIASSYSKVEFVLRREGLLRVPEEVQLSADAGRLCHKIVELSAPQSWRKSIEQSRVVPFGVAEVGTVGIRVTPDYLPFYYRNEKGGMEIFPLELKSGSTPFELSRPKARHWLQVVGQAEIMKKYFEQNGEEVETRFAAVHYMRDDAYRRPWTCRVSVGEKDPKRKLREKFMNKMREFLQFQKLCVERPAALVEEYLRKRESYPHLKPAFREEPDDGKKKIRRQRARESLQLLDESVSEYAQKHSLEIPALLLTS